MRLYQGRQLDNERIAFLLEALTEGAREGLCAPVSRAGWALRSAPMIQEYVLGSANKHYRTIRKLNHRYASE